MRKANTKDQICSTKNKRKWKMVVLQSIKEIGDNIQRESILA